MKRFLLVVALVATAVLAPTNQPAGADEGMWMPTELGTKLTAAILKKNGITIAPKKLWNPGS